MKSQFVHNGAGLASGAKNFNPELYEQYAKAIAVTNASTDHANLGGGIGELREESLDTLMRSVVAKYDSFKFTKSLTTNNVQSVLHEFMIQNTRGGQVQGRFNSETGAVTSNVGSYERWFVQLKFFMDMATVSHVATRQKLAIKTAKALEVENSLVRISESANWAAFHGDSSVAPNAYDGLDRQLATWNGGAQTVDLDGTSDINQVVERIFELKARTRQRGRFGDLNEIWTDDYVQNDLDAHLRPQFRVGLNAAESIIYGAPVSEIKTSTGNLKMNQDVYQNNPSNTVHPLVIDGAVPDNAPAAPTLAAAAVGVVADSKFVAGREGEYYYAVAGINANGVIGAPSAIVSATVVVGGGIDLSVTLPATGEIYTGIAVYRSVKDPAAVPTLADLRLLGNYPATVGMGAVQVVRDDSTNIAGSSTLYLLNNRPEAIDMVQLQAPIIFNGTAPTNQAIYQWLVLHYCALRLGLPMHHWALKGFISSASEFQPFG